MKILFIVKCFYQNFYTHDILIISFVIIIHCNNNNNNNNDNMTVDH